MYENIKLYIACTSLNVHFGAKQKNYNVFVSPINRFEKKKYKR